MRISKRKYAITGASRGLGAALAIVMAEAGAQLVLLARNEEKLEPTLKIIRERTDQQMPTLCCDLSDSQSCSAAGVRLASEHADLDGLIHNGAMWSSGLMGDVSDLDIQSCISSAAIGSLILTRHLLPILKARDDADIHTVVSTSGITDRTHSGGSIAFKAAKCAQAGFVQALSDELAETRVRVTSVFPDDFRDISPSDASWSEPMQPDDKLSSREVVASILFMLNLPPLVAVKSLVIE